jgi:hypothetical protein
VLRAHDTPNNAGLHIEAHLSTHPYQTEDAAERTAAFVAKRKPAFKDR